MIEACGYSRYAIVNLGCKVNRAEMDALSSALSACGASSCAVDDADVIFVNTCTVTGTAQKKSRKAIAGALRKNPLADVVVLGCAARMDPDGFTSMGSRVHIASFEDIAHSLGTIDAEIPLTQENRGMSRRGLKIQDGCDNSCTYCIVRLARGKSRSYPASEIIQRARSLMDSGIREIMVVGIDIGSYSFDGLDLPGLLSMLLEATDGNSANGTFKVRYRLSSIEPERISQKLLETIASSGHRICAHLHIPLQSGSDRILHRMNRHYTAGEYLSLIRQARALLPSMAITSDVIVGFPGETEADFKETYSLCRTCRFSGIHVFPYSRRPGTVAYDMKDQVEDDIKHNRAKLLRELANDLKREDLEGRRGTSEFFLVQSADDMMSESYHLCKAPDGAQVGSIIKRKI